MPSFWAAVLRAGPAAALSHQTAAELYGLLAVPAPMIHVTVPSGSPVARPHGVALHFSGRLDQSRHPVLTPPRTRIEDTVLDLIEASPSLDEAVSLILRGQRQPPHHAGPDPGRSCSAAPRCHGGLACS